MDLFDKKISAELIEEERLKGARLSVNFRWVFIFLVTILLLIQFSFGYRDIFRHSLILIAIYTISNLIFWQSVRRNYNPGYLGFLGATVDITIICFHLYGMSVISDYTAATAAATIFLIPVIFLIYTFRLDRGLMFFLIGISLAGFNLVYFLNYFQAPEIFQANLSLTPISHLFKSIYILFIGLLCVYMQSSLFQFLEKQMSVTVKKAELDAEIKIEQQKNKFARQLIENEKALIRKLEEEIRNKDALADQLKENKAQIKSIISNLLGFTYRCMPDDEWTMLFMSDQIENISGYSSASFTGNNGMNYKSIIHPDDLALVIDELSFAILNNRQFDLEYRIINKNGNHVWVHESGRGVYDKSGNIRFIDGIITDISIKKQAEIELRETRDLVKTLISNLVGAVSRCRNDEFFTTIFYSEKILEITGYHADDFIDNKNINFTDITHPEDIEMVRKNIGDCVKNKKPYSIEFRIIHKNGHVVWISENGRPIYDNEGNLLYLDGITTEITEKKIAERSLIEAKQELERLNEKLEKAVEERTEKLTQANTQLLKLQKENLQSQFEVLKQQVNPHFLFNSLNVLTSLIKVDPDLAEVFTERLSIVYRNVLENKDKDLVSLGSEMDFIKAYVFLLDIRFSNKVFVNINIDEKDYDSYVVPLALQLLIENAIKHNTFSKINPLTIELFVDESKYLNITNNLQSRKTQMMSTGIGLVNISKRYLLLSERQPAFEVTKTHFIARIPLIQRTS
jgi:PAS domain S-box-containing protein